MSLPPLTFPENKLRLIIVEPRKEGIVLANIQPETKIQYQDRINRALDGKDVAHLEWRDKDLYIWYRSMVEVTGQ